MDVPFTVHEIERDGRPSSWRLRRENKGSRARDCTKEEIELWQLRCSLIRTIMGNEKRIEELEKRLKSAERRAAKGLR